jgi:hypothetical protein
MAWTKTLHWGTQQQQQSEVESFCKVCNDRRHDAVVGGGVVVAVSGKLQ